MYVWLGFSTKAAKLFIREKELVSPERLRVLTDKNVDDTCNVMWKSGSKSINGMPNRKQQISVIAQKNMKLAALLFHHWWRCTFDWEVMGVHDDTVHLLVGQKMLEDEYKDPDVLPKVDKADMAGTMELINLS